MRQAPGGYIPEVLPLDLFRAIFTGRQWGTAAEFLHYRVDRYAPAFALSLLHDVLVRAHSSSEEPGPGVAGLGGGRPVRPG